MSTISGPLLIAVGAALFACTNATSTAFYRRGGTIITVYVIRCVVIFVANGVIVWLREGPTAARHVMMLRSGRIDSSLLALLRGLIGSAQAFGLNVALVFLTFADAFTIFKGVDSLSTVLLARTCMDSGERLTIRELLCGCLTLFGIVMIAQPPLLFGASATKHVHVAALGVAALAGTLSAGFGVFTRVLSKAGTVHATHLSPAMLLSHKLLVMFAFFSCIGLVGHATGISELHSFHWLRFKLPVDATDWILISLHCMLTLGAQLALASGYATTRAGIGGFLQLTELAWVYVIDIVVLAEPTNVFSMIGTGLVFASAMAVLGLAASEPKEQEAEEEGVALVSTSDKGQNYGAMSTPIVHIDEK